MRKTSRTSGTRAVTGQKVWQVYGKMVGSELTALNAPKVPGKLPDITYWACNILMEHRSEIVGLKLSQAQQGEGCLLGQVDQCGIC